MRRERCRLVFIDETGTTTKMTRLRGRTAKGCRLNSCKRFCKNPSRKATMVVVKAADQNCISCPW